MKNILFSLLFSFVFKNSLIGQVQLNTVINFSDFIQSTSNGCNYWNYSYGSGFYFLNFGTGSGNLIKTFNFSGYDSINIQFKLNIYSQKSTSITVNSNVNTFQFPGPFLNQFQRINFSKTIVQNSFTLSIDVENLGQYTANPEGEFDSLKITGYPSTVGMKEIVSGKQNLYYHDGYLYTRLEPHNNSFRVHSFDGKIIYEGILTKTNYLPLASGLYVIHILDEFNRELFIKKLMTD
jgi:hypothetical protein